MTWQTGTRTAPDVPDQHGRSRRPAPVPRHRAETTSPDGRRWPVQSMFGPLLHEVDRVAD